MPKKYEKVFTREFTLPWLEIWYQGEARAPKPWNNQVNKSFPYIVFVYHDDTVSSYYDMEGLNWSRNLVLTRVKNDPDFVAKIISEVTPQLNYLSVFLDKSVLTEKNQLLDFFEVFKQAYPWLLPMWEIGESDPEQIEKLNVSPALELKESTMSLTDDVDNLIRNSLQKIFPRIGEYSHLLTIAELQQNKIPDLEELKLRACGFIFTDGTLYRPDQIELIESKYNIKLDLPMIAGNLTQITGNPASGGYAKGQVRKIMALKHLDNFHPGEILVSPMTMPDFVPAMKKAAAIITDEGGITCHAAIIARELKVPCVVGTKIATAVLQNGDLVEVDANLGIIRIIKRAT